MHTYSIRVAAVFLGLILLASARAENGSQVVYQEPLEQVRMAYTTPSGLQKPGAAQVRSLRFDAFGKRFDIDLEPNHSLLNAAQRVALDNRIGIYRGEIAGMPNSWARLVIENDMPRGMLWDGEEMWAVEVVANEATGAEEPIIYRLQDLQITPGALTCSHVRSAKNAAEFAKAMLAEGSGTTARALGAASQLDMAVIGDFEFTTAKGASVDTALIARMNNVDGIFSEQLGVQLNVNRIDTYTANNDPFTGESESGALLDELTAYRLGTPAQYANGLTHLFTGRDLDTSTVGIAYTGALCSRGFGAGLTQGTHSETMDSLIAAHEIGHNFGAPHDGTSGACESETGEFLMAPRLNGIDQFSSCSITEILDDISRARCISALPGTDVAVIAGGQPAAVLLGNSETFTFEVNSVGTDSASGVNVELTIPSGVALNSASWNSGTCTSGAGVASCAIGAIAAGSGVTVTVAVATLAVGDADFVASITADTDANGNNNQATVRLTVDPAVDLVSTAATAAQLSLNASTTIRPNIENRSSISATSITVTVTPNAGIRIDSASWSPGSCNIASNVLTCQAASLAAQSSDALQIAVTGISEGNQSYAMTVSATETDRNSANNNASGQVNVGPVGGGGADGSGGGSLGWLTLLLLILVRLLPLRFDRSLYSWPRAY